MALNERTRTKSATKMAGRASVTFVAAALALPSLSACNTVSGTDGFSEEEWKSIRALTPLAKAPPPSFANHMSENIDLARFGQALFFETDLAEPSRTEGPRAHLGEPGKVGCVSCHDTKYFTDSQMVISQGADRYEQHNSLTLANVKYWDWYLWIGLFDSLMMHGCFGTQQEASPLGYAHYVFKKYRAEYDALFPETPLPSNLDDEKKFPPFGAPGAFPGAPPTPYDTMADEDKMKIDLIRANVARAFDAYPRHLDTRNSDFEKYLAGDHAALTPEAKRGLRLFVGKAACNDCHNGPLLSDQKFHNIGIPTPMGQMPDTGRASVAFFQFFPSGGMPGNFNLFNGAGPFSDDPVFGQKHLDAFQAETCASYDPMMGCTPKDELIGAFRTPTLLNIAETGPYFHTGDAKTLEEVVAHYNRGGGTPGTFAGTKSVRLKPLGLTSFEISDLVAFLHSLTGEYDEPTFAKPPMNPKPPLGSMMGTGGSMGMMGGGAGSSGSAGASGAAGTPASTGGSNGAGTGGTSMPATGSGGAPGAAGSSGDGMDGSGGSTM